MLHAFFFRSEISSSQKHKLSFNSSTDLLMVLVFESRTETSFSSWLINISILDTEVGRLLRRISMLSNLSSLDSLVKIRSTFSAKSSAIPRPLRMVSSELELSFDSFLFFPHVSAQNRQMSLNF